MPRGSFGALVRRKSSVRAVLDCVEERGCTVLSGRFYRAAAHFDSCMGLEGIWSGKVIYHAVNQHALISDVSISYLDLAQ